MQLLRLLTIIVLLCQRCSSSEMETQLAPTERCPLPNGIRPEFCIHTHGSSSDHVLSSGDYSDDIPVATICLLVNNHTKTHVLCSTDGKLHPLTHEYFKSRVKRFGEMTSTGIGLGAPFGPVGAAVGAAAGFIGDILCLFMCHDDSGPPPNKPPSLDIVVINGSNPVITDQNKTTAVVNWAVPVAHDPEGEHLTVTSIPKYTNHTFEEGSYFISFSTRDSGGLSAYSSLSFQVEVLRCPQPNWPENGRLMCSDAGHIYGSVCYLKCKDGYMYDTSEQNMITCTRSGKSANWNPATLPSCTPRKCETLPHIDNGYISCLGNEVRYKSICSAVCNRGFMMRSNGLIMCHADGSWPQQLPVCEDNEPPSFILCPDDMNVNIDSKDNTASVTWDLPTGTDNSGDDGIIIQEQHGHSSGIRLKAGIHTIRYTIEDKIGNRGNICSFTIYVSSIECQEPDFGNHMMYACADSYRFGAECQLSCRSGYPIVGVEKIQCSNPTNSTPPKLEWMWDRSDLKPECIEKDCQDLDAPANGALSCSLWDHGNMCQMQCQQGFDVPLIRDAMYVCGKSDGQWRPDENVPDCIKKIHARQMHLKSELFYYTGQCNSSAQNLEQIRNNFIQALNVSKFHEQCVGVPECQSRFVNVTCGPVTNRRRRGAPSHIIERRSTARSAYAVTFDMTVPYTIGTGQSSDVIFSKNEGILYNMIDVVQTEIDAGKFELHIGDLHTDSSSLGAGDPGLLCPRGTQGNTATGTCRGCPTGRFYSFESGDCQYCPVGTYQNISASVDCITCPPNTNTTDEGTKTVEQCLDYCTAGSFSSTGLAPCTKCPADMFQPEAYQTGCLPCETGKRAVITGSATNDACKEYDISIRKRRPITILANKQSPALSFQSWIKLRHTNSSVIQTLIQISSKDGRTNLAMNYERSLSIYIDGNKQDTGAMIVNNKWTHVSFSIDTSLKESKVYINGQQVHSTTTLPMSRSNALEPGDNISIDGDIQLSAMTLVAKSATAADISRAATSCHAIFANALYTLDSFANSSNVKIVVPSKCDAVDECTAAPCGSFECHNKIGRYECICSRGYTGSNCETPPDLCGNNSCQNGATCMTGISNYTCMCPSGYNGHFCESPAVDGAWSEWSHWTACSVSCGRGQSIRTRDCDSPAPDLEGKKCQGGANETRTCSTFGCPKCSNLRRSFGVLISCNDTGDDKRCTLHCRDGLFFAMKPLEYYECGKITNYVWNHVTKDNPHGRIPACSSNAIEPPPMMSVSLESNYDNFSCTSANVNDAKKQLESKFSSLDCIAKQTCQATVVQSGCNGQIVRKKRETEANLKLTVHLEAHIDPTITVLTMEQLIANNSGNTGITQLIQQILDLDKSAQQIANNSKTFFQMSIGGQQTTIVTGNYGLKITSDVSCTPGAVRLQAFCAYSPAGSYSDGTKLIMCPKGQYQDVIGRTSCKQCPSTTTTVGIGSTNISDCSEESRQSTGHGNTADDDDIAHTVGIVVGTVVTIGFFMLCGVAGTLAWKHLSKRKRQVNDNYTDLYGLKTPTPATRVEHETNEFSVYFRKFINGGRS